MKILHFLNENNLVIIWGIFTVLFSVMTLKEYKKSKENLKSLDKFKLDPSQRIMAGGPNLTEVMIEFKNELNKSNKESHKIASLSYFLASLTSLVSFIISFLSNIKFLFPA